MSALGPPAARSGSRPRIVVTGGAGFIGAHLISALCDRWDADVVAIDNERSGDWRRVTAPCARVTEDLASLSSTRYEEICDEADLVFHLAAEKYNSSKSTPERVIDVNVSATERLFTAAARVGVPKVVFTSSLYAYGSMGPEPMSERQLPAPTTVYGMSKIAGEHLLRVARRDHGLAWSVARLFFVYGPRQFAEGGYKSVILSNFERLRVGDRPTIYGDGTQALDYVYIDDVVDALLRLADRQHDGQLYNIGSGEATTVNDLTQRMLAVAGSTLAPAHLDADWTAGSRRVGDVRAAADGLGWTATTELDEGLARVWDWTVHGG